MVVTGATVVVGASTVVVDQLPPLEEPPPEEDDDEFDDELLPSPESELAWESSVKEASRHSPSPTATWPSDAAMSSANT